MQSLVHIWYLLKRAYISVILDRSVSIWTDSSCCKLLTCEGDYIQLTLYLEEIHLNIEGKMLIKKSHSPQNKVGCFQYHVIVRALGRLMMIVPQKHYVWCFHFFQWRHQDNILQLWPIDRRHYLVHRFYWPNNLTSLIHGWVLLMALFAALHTQ